MAMTILEFSKKRQNNSFFGIDVKSVRFRSYDFWKLVGRWSSVLGRIEHFEKYATLAPIQMPSQETFNTNIVANFLRFLTATRLPWFN
jgi:hypothetical protein